jgi:hypothetical protein
MNTETNIITTISIITFFITLYILRDTIGEYLFGGVNCNPKG